MEMIRHPLTGRWLVLLALGWVVAACGASDVEASTTSSKGDTTSSIAVSKTSTTVDSAATTTTAEPVSETTQPASTRIVQLAFAYGDGSDCSDVNSYARNVDETLDPIETVFTLLVSGPTADEMTDGAGSLFSDQTSGMVRSVSLNDGLLVVDFEDLRSVMNNASTSCGSESLLAQLNSTAFQFEQVDRVRYEIEGSCDTFFNWLQRDCQEYTRP